MHIQTFDEEIIHVNDCQKRLITVQIKNQGKQLRLKETTVQIKNHG